MAAITRSRTELAAVWPPNAEVAGEVGHRRQSPLRAIREKCLDCFRLAALPRSACCEAVSCALWPFRAGRHPWTASGEKPSAGRARAGAGDGASRSGRG